MSLRNTLTYQRGKLPPAAVNRMALVWENIPAYIYMVWFFFIILQPNDGKEARMESHADTPSAMNTITSTKQQLR